MERIEEWNNHYKKSNEALLKARDSQRKRTTAVFDLFNHRLSGSTGNGVFTASDKKSQDLIKEISDGMSGMIFNGLLAIAEALKALEISIEENDVLYVTFDNNNFSFIHAFLKSIDDVILVEFKKIAKEIKLIEYMNQVGDSLKNSEITDKDQQGILSVNEILSK